MVLSDALRACPIVAILRGVRPEECVSHAAALHAAGIRVVEVPLNSPEPLASIRQMAAAWGEGMAVGAGTVLSAAAVDAVARAGGRLVVAPNTDMTVIGRALELGLEPAPGFASATEAFAAYGAGARNLKLFPAATYGPAHLRQLSAVLPADARVWAVGGVGVPTLGDWWAAGACAFGVGGELYRPGQTPQETRERAGALVEQSRALTAASAPRRANI